MDNTTVILAEQEFEFAYNSQFGAPAKTIVFGASLEAFTLQMDVNYRVTWDGVSYPVQLQDVSAMFGPGYYALGNAAAYDSAFSGNNEPFVIGWTVDGLILLAVDGSTAKTHTVGIFYGADDEEDSGESDYASNDAIILSYSQNPVVYKNIPKVWLTHPDSTEEAPILVPFSYGDAVAGVEVVPDFSTGNQLIEAKAGTLIKSAIVKKPDTLVPENIAKGVEIAGVTGIHEGGETEEVTVELNMADGDQIVSPTEAGKAMSRVTVKKPNTLIPENIAEGVDIAGIIGVLAAGDSGGGGAKFATGIFGTSTNPTVYHNLGVVPDLVLAYQNSQASQGKLNIAIGFSKSFKAALGLSIGNWGASKVSSTTTKMSIYTHANPIEDAQEASHFVHSATDTVVKFGGSNSAYQMYGSSSQASTNYTWIAIGGLT